LARVTVSPPATSEERALGLADEGRRAHTNERLLTWASRAEPIAVGAALLLPSLVWVLRDRSIWPWDPAWYGQVSVDLWNVLRFHPSAWHSAMSHAFGLKPPAIAWLGQFFVPFGYRLDAVEPALLVGVVACQAATVVLVYAAVRRLDVRKAVAFTAAMLVAGAPLFVANSQAYFAEPIQTLSVAWLLFVMASATRWPLPLVVTQVVAACSLGMLSKLSSPLFLTAPALVSLGVAVRTRRRPDRSRVWRDPHVVASIVVAAFLLIAAIDWYSKNLHAAVEHARTIDNPLWGQPYPYLTQMAFWAHALDRALLLPGLEAIVIVTVLAAAIGMRGQGRRVLASHQALCFAACALTILVTLAIVSRQIARETRYIAPLLPIAGLALAILAAQIRARAVQAALVLAVGFQFAAVTADSFGARIPGLHYARVRAPRTDAFLGTLRDIAASTCNSATNGRISMVGVDYPWLNANTLTLLAHERFSRRGISCYYTPLGLAESDTRVAWRRVLSFEPPYFVGIDYGNARNPLPAAQQRLIAPSDAFNVVNRSVFRLALNSGRFEVLPRRRHAGLIVLRWRANA
jgi:hypothetical protein